MFISRRRRALGAASAPAPVAATLTTSGMTFTAATPGSAANGTSISGGVFYANNPEAGWQEVGFPVFEYACVLASGSATPASVLIGTSTVFWRNAEAGNLGAGFAVIFGDPGPNNAAAYIIDDGDGVTFFPATDGSGNITSTYLDLTAVLTGDSSYLDASGGSIALVTNWGTVTLEGGADPEAFSTDAEIIAALVSPFTNIFTGVANTPSFVPQSFGGLLSGGSD